jgi:hypothetical protein
MRPELVPVTAYWCSDRSCQMTNVPSVGESQPEQALPIASACCSNNVTHGVRHARYLIGRARDSSRLAKSILYNSLFAFPCTAAILLGWQATARISSGYWVSTGQWFHPIQLRSWLWHWHYTVLLKILVLFLAAITSGYLGLLSWKYRPQTAPEPPTPPTCPAQMFE